MKRPTDISLGTWIRRLIKQGKLYRFYKCDEWIQLRQQVLEDNHFECEDCRGCGVYTRAYCVHHDREVRDYPDLALSRTYRDKDGEHKNLYALCYECHERRHDRAWEGQSSKRKKTELEERVPERW